MNMASAARKPPEDNSGEVKVKDFAGAKRTYNNDIKPAAARVGDAAQEMSTAYKHIKKNCNIQAGAAKLAFKLADMEDAKRDDWLRGFNGLIAEMGIALSPDLVDAMETKQKPKIALVTIPAAVEGDTDLAGEE
jgi:predicted regulator of amino acid metabolism with ACT domain